MSATQLGWFWRFNDGILAGLTIPTHPAEGEGNPPEAILVYPSPQLADAIFGDKSRGVIPVPDSDDNRATLLTGGDISASEIHLYKLHDKSQITDEQYDQMRQDGLPFTRGAEYEYVGTLA